MLKQTIIRSLHVSPVKVSLPTHFHPTSSSLTDLVFVNNGTVYDQISASCFSNHDLLFLSYDVFVSPDNRRITYRDFQNIDFTVLNSNVDIC